MSLIDTETLLAPIPGVSPTGEDARYEFCYEMMETEVKKFGSLFGETVDWHIVKVHSIEVLSQHSKDLKALCYLIRALVEENGVAGLDEGLSLLNESISHFGGELYPKRKRGRDGAVEWLNHQIKLVSTKLSTQSLNWEALSRCVTLVESIQRQFDQIFQDSDADFFEIKTQLNQLMQNASPSEEILGQDRAVDTGPLTEASGKSEKVKGVDAQPPLDSSLTQALSNKTRISSSELNFVDVDTDFSSPTASKRTLKKVAEMMMHSNPTEALGYRIYRHLTWFDVDGLPDHQENVTQLSLAVSLDQQVEYRDKAHQESDIDTIKRLERTLTDAPFWLTGHYFVYSMLSNLGYGEAATAVKQETRRFINSFNGIESLFFKNSIPFADEATITWLSTGNSSSSDNSSIVQSIVVSEDDLSEMEDIALEDLGMYVAELSKKLELDNSGRGQFMLHLKLVKAYQNVGLYPLCLPYLEKNWEVSKELNLSIWEPHLFFSLEHLIQKTLRELYRNKDFLPEIYSEWGTIYDQQ
ncbi:type VI secretion system protein TssA [Vibrio sp. SNU_ST1]|uniref:type VI secretion system protein TssA n=1 Tax=Vibrio sp. SNU_ST1 TaxID=3064001 RepID=UPI002729CDA2|nr:type VI secretion system protein TssA [Vibrio sp. SNU_ST1]WKY59636.1 type VI secretion system protein TssA [Vibrio sp. SNU_ST1]